jgi:diguanylate cyclase (GGDEF)-like protein/PAS domain S-box-containing protein
MSPPPVVALRVLEVMDVVPDVVGLLDPERRLLQINAACERLWGLPPERLLGQPFEQLVVESARAQAEIRPPAAEQNLVLDGQTLSVRAVDGSLRETRWFIYWLADQRLFFLIGRDMTALRETEGAAREQRKLLDVAGRMARVGGWAVTLPSGRCEWSSQVSELLGIAPQPGTRLSDLLQVFTPASRGRVYAAVDHCAQQGEPFDIEAQVQISADRRMDIRLSGLRERAADGEAYRVMGALQDISEQKDAERAIEKLAYHDMLTGLGNRLLLLNEMAQERALSLQTQTQAALCAIDIVHFKHYNDSFGHTLGDALLQDVAQRLQQVARDSDVVVRTGNDDFMILMRGLSADPERAAAQARRMVERIEDQLAVPFKIGEVQVPIQLSFGITLFGQPPATVEQLLLQAETAQVVAKHDSESRLRLFDPQLQAELKLQASNEAALRDAIGRGLLTLHVEPQVDDDDSVWGVEALVRWPGAPPSLRGPADFIPIAESTGLIIPLGRQVLQMACAQLVAWSAQPETARLRVSVNVSAWQFRHPDFVEELADIVEDSGADPRMLVLELTESLLLENVPEVIARMRRLKALGIQLAIDDFGTGYSSLAYLRQLPLDLLKIDRAFVQDVLVDDKAAAIVRTIIALARNLDLQITAEGVESAQHRSWLAAEGCTHCQGYYFARPQSPECFEAWLRAR